jgi:hypothetical protein
MKAIIFFVLFCSINTLDFYWNVSSSGAWNNPSNWICQTNGNFFFTNTTPSNFDNVYINRDVAITVSLNVDDLTIWNLTIGNSLTANIINLVISSKNTTINGFTQLIGYGKLTISTATRFNNIVFVDDFGLITGTANIYFDGDYYIRSKQTYYSGTGTSFISKKLIYESPSFLFCPLYVTGSIYIKGATNKLIFATTITLNSTENVSFEIIYRLKGRENYKTLVH